jgi:hypothetical protein
VIRLLLRKRGWLAICTVACTLGMLLWLESSLTVGCWVRQFVQAAQYSAAADAVLYRFG